MSPFCSNQTSSRKFDPFKVDLINFMIFRWHTAPQLCRLFCTFETHQHHIALKIFKKYNIEL